jgi:hypothetical protein
MDPIIIIIIMEHSRNDTDRWKPKERGYGCIGNKDVNAYLTENSPPGNNGCHVSQMMTYSRT